MILHVHKGYPVNGSVSRKDYVQREHYGKDLKEGDSYPESEMTERGYSRGLDLGKSHSTRGMDKRESGAYKGSVDKNIGASKSFHSLFARLTIWHTLWANISTPVLHSKLSLQGTPCKNK